LCTKLKFEHLSAQLDTLCEQAAKRELNYREFLGEALGAERVQLLLQWHADLAHHDPWWLLVLSRRRAAGRGGMGCHAGTGPINNVSTLM
jgi:hypothetical protein